MTDLKNYDLYCEFDMRKHKEKYVNYLEVIIEEDGHIVYAVPSHQEKLIYLCMWQNNWTRQQVYEAVPKEMYFDLMEWLCDKTGAVSVWERSYIGKPNKRQMNALKKLKLFGLYKGYLVGENK